MAEPFDSRADRPSPRSFAMSADRTGPADTTEAGAQQLGGVAPHAERLDRQAAEWGLASLLTGGFLMLFVPPAWLFALVYWNTGTQVVATANRTALLVMTLGIVASYVGLIGLCVASVAIGFRALQASVRHRQPAGLPLAGTIFSAAALLFITLTGAGLLAVVLSFAR